MRVPMKDADALDGIITYFINYVRPEVKDFREAIEIFKQDLPTVLNALRDLIDSQIETNAAFKIARAKFWSICKESINPEVTLLDVREMIIQHILTEDIFISIFNESQFHRENNIARELKTIIDTFFTGSTKKNTLGTIERYYGVIRRTAANIYNHHEKQKFLKVLYENFYKAYNPKAADRLGIVYTPNEIVRFMIESVDYLVHKNFGKLLADKDVEILDPATGTGTFITELIDYLPKNSLEYKYKHEIHCNEVAILPYYIANLNIEYTYKQKMGEYQEFENICFVDTLEHTSFEGKQMNLLSLSVENTERIKRQNESKISVIIGNPPYNANQANENDNNKNRLYPDIDKLIKDSYVKYSNAQKTKVYDMYARFFRWATNKLNENGILAFITNSSFINAKTFDGFRKAVDDEFSEIYIIDLGGDVRANPKISGTKHNVFGIQTGVAISFMVKKKGSGSAPCKIFYTRRPEFDTAEDKLKFLGENIFTQIAFDHITPDQNNNWIKQADNDFPNLLPLASKDTKFAKSQENEKALFKLVTQSNKSNRDEWVYDFSQQNVAAKVKFFYKVYESEKKRWFESNRSVRINDFVDRAIKWTSELEEHLLKASPLVFNKQFLLKSLFRPFVKTFSYADKIIIHRQYRITAVFPGSDTKNLMICISDSTCSKPFHCLASDCLVDYHLTGDSQCLSLYRYDKDGNRIDNITNWGLAQFQTHYNDSTITKLDIFNYTYAVLHNPAYRTKYELNLKREFPRIPFYDDFHQWVNWGKQLMDLHINYETVQPYPLKRIDLPLAKNRTPKAKLKADTVNGTIILDDVTTLEGVPKIAWEYRLGNRCALEWILDQYKEKKPKDPTIAEKFNTYRFADYKEQVVDLLQRVCTVSVETMQIIQKIEVL